MLTWSAIEGLDYETCNHDHLLERLKSVIEGVYEDALEYACICIERHKDRPEPHFHAAIKLRSRKWKLVSTLAFCERVPNVEYKKMKEFWIAIGYVKKEGKYIEIGELFSPGKLQYKDKIEKIKNMDLKNWIENGAMSFSDVKLYKETKAALCDCYQGPRVLYWYYGSTGTGKTKTAWENAQKIAMDNCLRIASITFSGKSFINGYDGEEVVLIDDFRRNLWPLQELLKMLDRYPYIANVKGGYSNWNARYIFITCPTDPIKAYTFEKNDEEHPYDNVNQLVRRLQEFGEIIEFPYKTKHIWNLDTLEEEIID